MTTMREMSLEEAALQYGSTHRAAKEYAALRARVAELERERDVFKRDYHDACKCIADMHRAAVGQITGPRRGVVEDVEDIHRMAECAAIMAVCGYFSRMRGPDAWLDHGSWDEYPELFACAGVDLRSFQHGTRFYAGSAPVPAARAVDAGTALSALSKAMQDDAGLAWSWHCNIAMTAQDAGAPHDLANVWAANFMRRAFDVDTLSRVNAMPA